MAVDGERAQEVADTRVPTRSDAAAPDPTEPGRPAPTRGRRWPVAVVAACAVLALAHAFVVGHAYFVGSFDDDANYILTTQALLHGQGLTGHLTSGNSVVSAYPPGLPLLLLPIEWLRSASYVPYQVFSALCFAAVFPLTWVWMKKLAISDAVCVGVMVLMALNVVAATFAAMVMAEMPYLVCLMLLLLAVHRWEQTNRLLVPAGVAVGVLGAELVWLKEAGVGFTLGVALWYLLRRRVSRAVLVVGTLGASLLPVVVARLVSGVPLAGARYTSEIGGFYAGNPIERVIVGIPPNVWNWLEGALPSTVVPDGAPFPNRGVVGAVLTVVIVQVTVFTLVGLVVAVRRHRDVAIVATAVYFLETAAYPYINERRVILVLPIVLTWYCLGLEATVRASARWAEHRVRPALRSRLGGRRVFAGTWALLALVFLLVPLVLQFPRDYLFGLGIPTSHPAGSRYMAILAALQPHETVVETDYRYTTALFSGHRTQANAFVDTDEPGTCTATNARRALRVDGAGYLLVGALNKHNQIDSPCLLHLADTSPWAVPLLRSQRDLATVFELIGPGTAHPDLQDLVYHVPPHTSGRRSFVAVRHLGSTDRPGPEPVTATRDGSATFTWSWGIARVLTQVSVGEAGLLGRLAEGAAVQIETTSRTWLTVASTPHGAGDRRGDAPYLLTQLPARTYALGMRVTVDGSGRAFVLDAAAFGRMGGQRA